MRIGKGSAGFTLTEIMIVVTIIGILSGLAYPSFMEHRKSSNRKGVQGDMVQIASRLNVYRQVNTSYLGASLSNASIYGSGVWPKTGKSLYDLTLTIDGDNQGWTLTAAPKDYQSNNGSVVINNQGFKCWTKGTTCVPQVTTNWNGK